MDKNKENKNPFKISNQSKFSVKKEGKYSEFRPSNGFFNAGEGEKYNNLNLGTSSFVSSSFGNKKKLIFLIFTFLVFLGIVSKIFFLQVVKGEENYQMAEKNRQRTIPIPSERGLIYDNQGRQLTKNIPKFSLTLIPQDLPNDIEERNKMISKLSELTSQPEEEIRKTLDKYGSYSYESIVIKENIDYETALSIQIAASDLPGIHIQRGSKRLYLLDNNSIATTTSSTQPSNVTSSVKSLSHVLGYQGKVDQEELDRLYDSGYLPSDFIGKTGIEKEYESYLRGEYGHKKVEVNAKGKQQKVLSKKAPKPGRHLILAIDKKIQTKLEQAMKKHMKEKELKKGAAVAIDPDTGYVNALVSLPGYNNNDFSGGISSKKYRKYSQNENRPLFNRVTGGSYPAGSTVKPQIAAAALQENIINKNTVFNSTGGIRISKWFFPDWQAGGHGITNVTKAIAWSVNTFFYHIGGGYEDFEGLGEKKIVSYLNKFGFGQKTGIDLPSEAVGFLPSKDWKRENKGERWYIGDTYNLSIGQGYTLASPLQVANATAAIANGGTLYKPNLVKKIFDPVTNETLQTEKQVLNNNFINSRNLEIVRQGMLECVVYGSCRRLSLLDFNVGGKTGTAQWSSTKENHAWFTSFAPYENPEIVLTVMVEQGGGGDKMAVPIAYDFYRWWGKYKEQNKDNINIVD